jgi:hypothetical protein
VNASPIPVLLAPGEISRNWAIGANLAWAKSDSIGRRKIRSKKQILLSNNVDLFIIIVLQDGYPDTYYSFDMLQTESNFPPLGAL